MLSNPYGYLPRLEWNPPFIEEDTVTQKFLDLFYATELKMS